MSESKDRYQQLKKTGNKDIRSNTYEVAEHFNRAYLKLRRAIGYLGIALPFTLVIFSLINRNGCGILPSISDYYHTSVGGIFVGILVSISIFLWYNGEDKQEKLICKFAALLAITIAFAPTPVNSEFIINELNVSDLSFFTNCYIPKVETDSLVGQIHFLAAALFFLLLSGLVEFVFRRKESKDKSDEKFRRLLYSICSRGMFISLLTIAVFKLFLSDFFPDSDDWSLPPTFTLETIMLIFFGVAWLVKGDVNFEKIKNVFNEIND